ncbi:hypothetical protein AJ80_09640 [Polytolypa hystricis UAMH7299]|uniref:Uncharacterized protein n=1 Tax=Polytolypa hystricis (strain UAMH7299) TaxID=1447883 RepID=A0A2B7WED9_POLH7|nr:hypothetical protein AJ80_09640 [Polytolypa hystricis UAMH7299]
MLPRYVFQLQCVVDSLSVSRGWSVSPFKGHILTAPARGFRPRRDVDLFLNRENEKMGHGFCQSVDLLAQLFQHDSMIHGDPNRHMQSIIVMETVRDDFVNFLGESKYMYGLQTIPPSRFSSTNSNDLWEYSPFLCGVGLMEGLEIANNLGMMIWENIPEPMCVLHLHNMLVQGGHITQPVGLFGTLEDLFSTSVFPNGKPPTSDFIKGFSDRLDFMKSPRAASRSLRQQQASRNNAGDIHSLMHPGLNTYFKTKSLVGLCREANWVPDGISDSELYLRSTLAMMRVSQTKQKTDRATGKKVLEETALVKRARADGMDDAGIMRMASMLQQVRNANNNPEIPDSVYAAMPAGFSRQRTEDIQRSPSLRLDLTNEISGQMHPIMGLNYIWATIRMLGVFMQIEDRLKAIRHPLWVTAYEGPGSSGGGGGDSKQKRASLAALVLSTQDKTCMRVMAEEMQNPRVGSLRMSERRRMRRIERSSSSAGGGACTVM